MTLSPILVQQRLKRKAAKAAKASKAAKVVKVVKTAKALKAAKAVRRRKNKRAKARGLRARVYAWDPSRYISNLHLIDHVITKEVVAARTLLFSRYATLRTDQQSPSTSMPRCTKPSRMGLQSYWLPALFASRGVQNTGTLSGQSNYVSLVREVVSVVGSPRYEPSFTALFSRFRNLNFRGHTLLIYHVKTPYNIRFYSKHEAPFIFSLCGFLFVQTNTLYSSTRRNSSWAFARIQKHQYSFFYKEDIKRFYLKKAGKLKLLASVINPLRFVDHNTLQKNLFRRQLHPITGVYSVPSSGTVAASHMNKPDSGVSFMDARLPVDQERYSNYAHTEAASEPRIKRIRFKPGYSRI